ncbi:unnamed protein product, partial [Toxocara canis]|uniref:Rubis-subs-bind domain-containing protein n=1 Tax=Toxocara canis TaxID=6265 RepID=A0A183TZ63_TOXCA
MSGFFEFVPLSFLENLCFHIEDVGDILNLQEAVPTIAIAIDNLFWDRQHSLVLGSRDQRIEWRALQNVDQRSCTIPCTVETITKIVSKAKNIKEFRMHRNSGFDEHEELLVIDAILNSESNTPHRVRLNVKCAQRDRAKCALQRAYQSALNNFTHRMH